MNEECVNYTRLAHEKIETIYCAINLMSKENAITFYGSVIETGDSIYQGHVSAEPDLVTDPTGQTMAVKFGYHYVMKYVVVDGNPIIVDVDYTF